MYFSVALPFLDAIAPTPVSQWVSESVSESLIVLDLEIAIASPSFASLLVHKEVIIAKLTFQILYLICIPYSCDQSHTSVT